MENVRASSLAAPKSPAGSRHQPARTRHAILDAAEREFAAEGIDGARTEAIARTAGVNKALLYYYFQDKESLYGAVLDRVFAGLQQAITEVLRQDLPPREKVLAYVKAHFDYIARAPGYPKLVQRGLMGTERDGSPLVRRILERYLAPLYRQLSEVIAQGSRAGEFRPVDAVQFVPTMVAVIVFYFAASPVLKSIMGSDPLAPERVAARRAAVLDFIAAALFQNPNEPQRAPAQENPTARNPIPKNKDGRRKGARL